jgi:DNA-directed RNA polymerase II subunit RPB1
MDTISDFVDIIVDNLKIKGIDDVSEVYDPIEDPCIMFDETTHGINSAKEFAIYSDGINMYDIRYIEGIDVARTICNDVMKVYDIFGIEAARIAFLREVTTLLENANGTFVNYQHLSIVADLMARDGIMISIDRHGMSKTETGPLGKASFEKPIEQLVMAAVFNETDPLKGVSSRIMTGQIIHGGTGMCDLIFDSEMVEKSEYIDDERMATKGAIDDADMRLMNDVTNKKYDDIFIPE